MLGGVALVGYVIGTEAGRIWGILFVGVLAIFTAMAMLGHRDGPQ